jgi:hypothetical protein
MVADDVMLAKQDECPRKEIVEIGRDDQARNRFIQQQMGKPEVGRRYNFSASASHSSWSFPAIGIGGCEMPAPTIKKKGEGPPLLFVWSQAWRISTAADFRSKMGILDNSRQLRHQSHCS